MTALAGAYVWLKALHIIAMVAWMAAMLYLPRLYVYHTAATPGGEADATFKVMESRLLRAIMTPAMIATWVFGLLMLATPVGAGALTAGWFHVKLALVIVLTAGHGLLAKWRKDFAAGTNRHSQRFYRIVNEAPTLILILVVLLVVVKPF